MVRHDVAAHHFNLLRVWDSVWQSTDVDVRIGEVLINHSHFRWKSFHVEMRTSRLVGSRRALWESGAAWRVLVWSRQNDLCTSKVIQIVSRGLTCELTCGRRSPQLPSHNYHSQHWWGWSGVRRIISAQLSRLSTFDNIYIFTSSQSHSTWFKSWMDKMQGLWITLMWLLGQSTRGLVTTMLMTPNPHIWCQRY